MIQVSPAANMTQDNLNNLHVVVTGGNSGIGFAAAKLFLSKGYKVTIVGRSKDRLEEARTKLEGNVEIGICDICSIASVDEFVKSIGKIDILANNAGVVMGEYKTSELGQELTFSTNHLGTMYLTVRLLENSKINERGSIVVVSSLMHMGGSKDADYFDKITEKNFSGYRAYSQSKLFNLLFARYLVTKYLPETYNGLSIKVTSVHPGYVPDTDISRSMGIVNTLNTMVSTVLGCVGWVPLSEYIRPQPTPTQMGSILEIADTKNQQISLRMTKLH